MSKFLLVAMVLGSMIGTTASATDAIEKQILSVAKTKSLQVYKGLSRIRATGIKAAKKQQVECSIGGDDQVLCEVTDINVEHGWTDGITLDWYVNMGTAPGVKYVPNFLLNSLATIQH